MRKNRDGVPVPDVKAIKWKCALCGSVQVSRSDRRHEMDACDCKQSALDLEEHYQRNMGAIEVLEIKEVDYKDMVIPGLETRISRLDAVKVLAKQDLENHVQYQVVEDAEWIMNVVTYYEEHHGISVKEGDELKNFLRNAVKRIRANETDKNTKKDKD